MNYSVIDRYQRLQKEMKEIAIDCGRDPQSMTLIAVTKNYPAEIVQTMYEAGCRDIGESRVQEALGKMAMFNMPMHWHLIGTLQKNKVAKAVGRFALIHSVDDVSLVEKISEISRQKDEVTSILLQVNISGEATKHGLNPKEWERHLQALDRLPGIALKGLMTMAPLTENEDVIRQCFRDLRLLREEYKHMLRHPQHFYHLSMGMSHDYRIAIEEGATLLRIGSALFEDTI